MIYFGTNFVYYYSKTLDAKIPGGNIMKTLTFAILSSAIVLASCSSSRYAASSEYDDIYYNPNSVERQAAKTVIVEEPAVTAQDAMTAQPIYQEPVYTKSAEAADANLSDYERYKLQKEAEMLGESYAPEGSEALYAEQYSEYDSLGQYGQESAPVIVNNYNYYTDPSDYYYSSNLRRFSDSYYGWNYYDPYYTDMYWYTGSRYSWGISMGWGYPGWGMRYSYGYPYYRPYYGYGGYYDPFYSWGYGGYYGGYYPYYGGSYWSGYNHGYYAGYYYGHSGNDRYWANTRYGRMDNRHYYGYSRPSTVTTGNSKTSTVSDPRYRSRSATASSNAATSTRSNTRLSNSDQRQVRSNTSTAVQRSSANTVRTTRTVNSQQRSTATERGTYTPSYSKPRTSSTTSYNKSVPQNRSYTRPATQQSTTNVQRSATTPSRSSSSYSRPSSPSRSTYSRPSSSGRSSSSYSRPSSSSRSSSSYSRPSSSSRSSSSYSRSSSGVSRSSGSVSRSSGSSSSGSVSRSSGSSSSGGSSRSSSSSRR